MTPAQHKKRHIKLHHALDELMADWIFNTGSLPSNCSVFQLMEWSYQQTQEPNHEGGSNGSD